MEGPKSPTFMIYCLREMMSEVCVVVSLVIHERVSKSNSQEDYGKHKEKDRLSTEVRHAMFHSD